MLKTLAAKAIVPVAGSITGFVVVCCILLYASMKHDRIHENTVAATDVASVIVKSTRYAMLRDDRETLQNIVANVGEESHVEHVRIFNKQGVIVFSARPGEVGRLLDKDAEGCSVCHRGTTPAKTLGRMDQARRFVAEGGEPVLAITAPVYNEPDCYTAECHHHSAEQTVLGTLDIALSEANLARTLRVMGGRLAVFSLMVLVLSVGGVAALLQRNVVSPVHEVQAYARRLARGERGLGAPDLGGELGEIARALEQLDRGRGGDGKGG
ncbi:MAG: HAMP domain-containing protein [Deferrisomatales bacterium]